MDCRIFFTKFGLYKSKKVLNILFYIIVKTKKIDLGGCVCICKECYEQVKKMAKRKYPSYCTMSVRGHTRRVHTNKGVKRIYIKPYRNTIGRGRRR